MTSGQDQSGGSDKRRFARLPINLDGLISIDGQTPVPCTARDFCVGGMFISADPAVYASVSPETPAVLYFALFIGGEKKDFQVNLLIARAVAKGIGVSFNEPDQETLDLLNQLAAAAAPPAPPDSTAALSETQQGFASEFATVVSPLTELVLEHVGNICDHFLERSDEVLFLAARDAGNNVDETRFLDGQREMRNRRDEIRAEVPTKIERGISIIGNPLSDQDKEPASMGLSDLSLVEKDEFEEFLAVSEMVSELEPLYNEALYALGQRFTYLSNREVEVSSIPIGPSVMCGAIAEGLKSLQSDRGVTKRIFEVLHDVMSADLGALYDKANELLVEQGIVPKIEKGKPVIKKKKGASRGVDASTDGAPDDTLNQPDDVQEEDFGDLMPSPDNYQGRPQVAPAAPRPAPQVHAAQPQIPAGYPQGPRADSASLDSDAEWLRASGAAGRAPRLCAGTRRAAFHSRGRWYTGRTADDSRGRGCSGRATDDSRGRRYTGCAAFGSRRSRRAICAAGGTRRSGGHNRRPAGRTRRRFGRPAGRGRPGRDGRAGGVCGSRRNAPTGMGKSRRPLRPAVAAASLLDRAGAIGFAAPTRAGPGPKSFGYRRATG